MSWVFLLLGMATLYIGGEFLVANSSKLARRLGVRRLIVGLTVVAVGTSAPELASSIAAVLQNAHGVAFGNAVGSNIANLGLVLGLAALINPVATGSQFLKREVPFMIVVSVIVLPMVLNDRLDRWEGAILLLLLVPYTVHLVRHKDSASGLAQRETRTPDSEYPPIWLSIIGLVFGVLLLVMGAKALVMGAVDIARSLGISERVIGLTLVAGGTSLPELAASLVAAVKKENDIMLGNLVGSNILNVLLIFGTTSMVRPILIQGHGFWTDLAVMVGFSIVVLPFLYTGLRLARAEGAILVLGYCVYVGYLFW